MSLKGLSVLEGLLRETAAPILTSHIPAAMSFNYSLESMGCWEFIIYPHCICAPDLQFSHYSWCVLVNYYAGFMLFWLCKCHWRLSHKIRCCDSSFSAQLLILIGIKGVIYWFSALYAYHACTPTFQESRLPLNVSSFLFLKCALLGPPACPCRASWKSSSSWISLSHHLGLAMHPVEYGGTHLIAAAWEEMQHFWDFESLSCLCSTFILNWLFGWI